MVEGLLVLAIFGGLFGWSVWARTREWEKLASRLDFESVPRERLTGLEILTPWNRDSHRGSLIQGQIEGLDVFVDKYSSLRTMDPAVPYGVRFSVAFPSLPNEFRIAPLDFAPSTADVCVAVEGLMIETGMTQDAERALLSGERHRVLSEIRDRWSVYEARHNRFIVIVPNMVSDIDGCEAIVRDLVRYAQAFQGADAETVASEHRF